MSPLPPIPSLSFLACVRCTQPATYYSKLKRYCEELKLKNTTELTKK